MPDHTDWPPVPKAAERAARILMYVVAAWAAGTVLPGLLGTLTIAAGITAAGAAAARWWHVELAALPVLVWAYVGWAVLTVDAPGTAALCAAVAAAALRRVAELVVFSAKVRQARARRVTAWQATTAAILGDNGTSSWSAWSA